MRALEFVTRLDENSTLEVPSEVLDQIRQGQAIRVILLVPEANDEEEWATLTAEQFLAGYAESDSIYDDLSAG